MIFLGSSTQLKQNPRIIPGVNFLLSSYVFKRIGSSGFQDTWMLNGTWFYRLLDFFAYVLRLTL